MEPRTLRDCDEMADLIPAYTLDALSQAEKTRVEQHLAGCADCRALLGEYRAVGETLLYAAPPVEAPARLEADLLRRLNPAAPPRARQRSTPSLRAWLAGLVKPPARLAFALAAASIVALAALVITNLYWATTVNRLQTQQDVLARQINGQQAAMSLLAEGGRGVALKGVALAPEALGTLVLASDKTDAVLVVDGLPPLPEGKVYQLWLIHDGARDSGGLFSVDGDGRGTLIVRAPRLMGNYQAVGVTVEPMEGSPAPTSPQMIGGKLL
jgi:anti-sigma-K factor RskA